MDLEVATTPHGGDLDVPAGWRQGRGAYGGLVCAAMVRAIEDKLAAPALPPMAFPTRALPPMAFPTRARPVRSLTAEIPAPVDVGAARIEVDVLRAGKSVTTARAALVQGGEVKAHAVAIAAAARKDGPTWNETVAPAVPRWEDLRAVPSGGPFPEFAAQFEFRIAEGVPGGGGAARTLGWIRARAPGRRRDAAYVAALIDAWYPAALVRMDRMRPMATIAFTLDVFEFAGLDGDAPLLYRGEVPVARDGYFVETRELWRADGVLVARNHQTFAVIA